MKDEVLAKAISTDEDIVPRYNIVRPDGTIVVENAQLILQNTIVTEGTPLNTATLLSDSVARLYQLTIGTATPNDVFAILHGLLPRVQVRFPYVADWIVQASGKTVGTFTGVDTGTIVLTQYGTYTLTATDNGQTHLYTTVPINLVVDAARSYLVQFQSLNVTVQVNTSEAGIAQCTVRALSPIDGSTLSEDTFHYMGISSGGYIATLHINIVGSIQIAAYNASGTKIAQSSIEITPADAGSTRTIVLK